MFPRSTRRCVGRVSSRPGPHISSVGVVNVKGSMKPGSLMLRVSCTTTLRATVIVIRPGRARILRSSVCREGGGHRVLLAVPERQVPSCPDQQPRGHPIWRGSIPAPAIGTGLQISDNGLWRAGHEFERIVRDGPTLTSSLAGRLRRKIGDVSALRAPHQ
jgi:hypothetical protein